MQLVTLKNFKSYENQVISNIHPRINVIIGQNGQGKSNFFKSIIFALTGKVHLNRNEYQSHLHRAVDNVPQPITVELYIRSQANRQSDEINMYKIERIWHSEQSQELRVEEKPFSKSDYESFIESLGFSYQNPYNILQQGKLNQIVLMDEFQLYKLLQDATSIRKYDRRHAEATNYITKNIEQKKDIKQLLKEIQTRLGLYQSRRDEFELYSIEEKVNKVRNKTEYQYLLKKFQEEIKELEGKEDSSSDQINKIKLSVKNIQNELEQVNSDISVNQKQMYEHFDSSTLDEEGDDLNLSVNLSQDKKSLGMKLKELKDRKQRLAKELDHVVAEGEKINSQIKPYKQKYQYMTSLISTERQSKQNKTKAKEQLKTDIQKRKEILREIESQLKKVNKFKSEVKVNSSSSQHDSLARKKQALGQSSNSIKANKMKYFESNREKNQYESQVDVFTKQIEVNYSKMRKILPLLEFNLLNQLRKEKVEGVYGFLIEFVEIDPSVLFAYEMSGLNKLCTLLVQNQKTCEHIVNVNKKIKGKQINILPLSFVERTPGIKKPKPPKIDDCYSLLNEEWVKVKAHDYGDNFTKNIQKIIMNTFNSHVLVKDYQVGLKVSKQCFLNCITADKEIVYSEGYLCKVGKDTNIDDRLQSYYKYSQKNSQLAQASQKLQTISKSVNSYQNKQMELMKDRITLESDIRNLELKIDISSEQKKSYDRLSDQQQKLNEQKMKYQTELKTKEEIFQNFDKANAFKINMKEYTDLKEEYNNKMSYFNQKSEQECQLQSKLQQTAKEEESLSEEMQNITHELSFQKDFDGSFVDNRHFKEALEKSNQDLQDRKHRLQSELLSVQQNLANVQNQNYVCLGNLSILQDQIQFYSEKLSDLGPLDTTMEELEDQSHSISMNVSNIQQRKKLRIFTAFEKLNFSKIEAWNQKYHENTRKLQQLEEIEEQIKDIITKFAQEKDQCVNDIFKNFQKHFSHIFQAITLHGKTDVRLKKVNQRNRGIIKARNSISIQVSFDGESEMTQKWNEYSGGQKTVIAVCLVMALQKCQPAPLYILDEIDSALDPVYLDRIVRLIQRESQSSQYFITSFKPAMLSFPDDKCNYYLVENHNRVSSMRRVNQSEAQSSLDLIIQS